MPTLAVVGAGAKGIAIAAKARALATAGLTAPRVVLADRGPVAGNWGGEQGYTNGLLPLSTPPEKDIGFPYADTWGAASLAVTAAMSDYSWQRHLIAQEAYADWVDRGRLRPTHREWSCYLRAGSSQGGGETAASIVISLLSKSHKRSTVDVLTARGVLYSRGESYDENRYFSDPGGWPRLAESHRREFIERTDRGVFSLQAEAILNQSRGYHGLAGRAVAIEAGDRQVVVTIEYGSERARVVYDPVVVAIGFDARWFEGLLGDEARRRLATGLAGAKLERKIGLDAFGRRAGPAAASATGGGARSGAGFPQPELLGLLTDRVLRRYVPLGEPAGTAAERSQRV
jgi:hypothetical protein